MANLKDLLVNGPSNLIGDVTVNKIRLTSLAIPSNNGTNDDMGSNGQVLKSNGTSVYWANDNNTTSFTITANATDGLWDLTGTNGTNSVTYALAPYSSKRTVASFYTGTTNPTLTTRLNYDGYLYAKKLYSDGAETITKNGGIINNSLTLQKSSTSVDSPELIFNGQAGNSDAYKWSIQKNSSGDLIFSKINSNNISTTTIVFSADGYLLPNTTDTYDLGSSSKKWRNIYGNLKGNADTATTLATGNILPIAQGGTGQNNTDNFVKVYTRSQMGNSINYDNPGVQGLFEARPTSEITTTGKLPGGKQGYYPMLSLKIENVMMQIAGSSQYNLGWWIRGRQKANVTLENIDWEQLVTNSGTWDINITGNAAAATTAGGITSAGTTAQFWRGDNTWSNMLEQTTATTLGINTSNLKIGRAIRTLHIATSDNGTGAGITDGNAAGITFGVSNAAYAGIYYQSSESYGSRLYFATTKSFGNGAYARMVITRDGNVGIGIANPQELLQINGNVCANNIYPKNSNNNNYSSYDLGKTDARWNKLYVNEFAPDEEYSAINIQFSNVWQDLKDSSDNLIHLSKSGTYIVQIYDDSHNDGASGHYQTYWSGIFSWYAGGVNGSGEYTEISLHGAGHAMNKKSIQLRTCSPLSSTMKFQIKGNRSTSTNNAKNTISIKFKFIM